MLESLSLFKDLDAVVKRSKLVASERCGSGIRALEGLNGDWCSQVDANQRCLEENLSDESARNARVVRVPEFN
jgi:hypothetical protein